MDRITGRVVLRYILIQLLSLTAFVILLIMLWRWLEYPLWILWVAVALWVAKDMVLFPFVWRAYDWGAQNEKNPMIGMQGIAKQMLDPSGYVDVRGELWQAELQDGSRPVERGERVKVIGISGLTLIVKHEGLQEIKK